ncbi:MAG TPA: efflux RND transporter periplasmic adaptor subunit [Pontiella sp.]
MKKTIKWIVALAVLAGGGWWIYTAKFKQDAAEAPTYDIAKVAIMDLRITVESTGEIQPRNRLDVKPAIAGRLEELMVDEGDAVDKGQILGWVSSTERATLLDAALATSEEEYKYWEELYKPTPLISPIRGTVIARNFEPGQSINANDAVVVIADDLIVLASLDETDIGQIKLGQHVKVRLESYPDTEFMCEVEKIAYDAKLQSNVTMYEIDVRPERLPGFARSGMTANLEFIIEERRGIPSLPASAIQQRSNRAGEGDRPGFQDMPPADRRAAITQRMKERGMSDAEIQERLARFANGGGRSGGGEAGGRLRGGSTEYYVLTDSGDPEKPNEVTVKTGMSDGSHTEIVEGLEVGDEVLIQRVSLGGGRSGGKNPFMPSFGGKRRS